MKNFTYILLALGLTVPYILGIVTEIDSQIRLGPGYPTYAGGLIIMVIAFPVGIISLIILIGRIIYLKKHMIPIRTELKYFFTTFVIFAIIAVIVTTILFLQISL